MQFSERCREAWTSRQSLLCVGLDPDLSRMPDALQPRGPTSTHAAVERFCREVIDATAAHCMAFKPQIAHFAALAAEPVLERLSQWVRQAYPGHLWILDAKRGDIGSTAERYAIEAFDRYHADAVTLSPYMGSDSLGPFLDRRNKGLFLLCRTSNPGAADLQGLRLASGGRLYEHVAALAAGAWNSQGQMGLVVGATAPEELARVRTIAPDLPLLIPGVGTQGGDPAAVIQAAATEEGGVLINVSRAILYPQPPISADGEKLPGHWQAHCAMAAQQLNQDFNQARSGRRAPETGGAPQTH